MATQQNTAVQKIHLRVPTQGVIKRAHLARFAPVESSLFFSNLSVIFQSKFKVPLPFADDKVLILVFSQTIFSP